MPNKIQIKRTSVTGRTPNTTNSGNSHYIDTGELALNITDGKLFSSNGLVSFEIGANLNSLSVGGAKLTANATLVNAVALNVVNQTNTATLYVTTSANVASAFLVNSTGAYHTGTVNAASHTVGTTTVVNSTAISLGPFGTTNGTNITTTSIDVGNSTANAALDYNIIYVANSTSRANLTPTTLAIGSITVNSALANLQALNVVNQINTATLYASSTANVGKLNVAAAGGDEGGEIYLDKPPNGTLSGGITVDSYQNRLRFFEQGGTNRGAYIDLASCGAGVSTNLLGSSSSVAGSNTQMQFNDSGAFGASAGFTFNKVTNNVTIANTVTVGTATVNGSLANLQALNVVNQTNTATLYVTTSANVGTAFTANSSLVNTIALNVVNDLNVGGNISLGDSSSDTITINGTIQPGVVISGSANSAALRITQTNTGTGALALRVEDSTNPDSSPFIIDAEGRVRIGTSTEFNEKLVLFSNNVTTPEPSIVLRNQYPGANGPNIYFDKQRNLEDPLVVLDDLGSIQFRGLQEYTAPQVGAIIRAEVDSSASAGFMPSTLRFSVTPNIADADPIERLTISGINNKIVANTNLEIVGTLTVANSSSDVAVIGTEPWDPGTINTYAVIGRTYSGILACQTSTTMTKLQNVAVGAARNHIGDRVYMMNESQNKSASGTLYNTLVYGFRSDVFNGNSAIGGDARVQALYGINTEVANYANGSNANTVQLGIAAQFEYASRGSGTTEYAYGVVADVGAGNNSITGNINFAYGIKPVIRSNTGMTINNGYLFYGTHAGSTTINKYGLYLENEGNNYISGNVYIAGAVSLGTFGVTNGVLITTTTLDVGNTTANAALDYNIIYVANSTSRANLTPTTLAIGSITVNSALANLQALNVVNQTNTATLYVTTSANVGTAFTTNSTLTNAIALNVVNTINVGSLGVTNGINITNTAISVGNSIVNSTLAPASLTTRRNENTVFIGTSSITVTAIGNSTANAFASIGASGSEYAAVELGGSLGGFIDFKSPQTDDYDYRFLANNLGLHIIGGSSTASANVVYLQSANLDVDSGALFVDGVNNRVGINNTAPGVALRVTGAADISSTANIQGNANVGGTLGITGAANALSTFGVNGLLFAAGNANIAGQTNTATLYVATSANIASAFLANSTGAYHTGTVNAASHTVGTNFTSNSSQLVLNAPSYTVSFSNTNGSATNYITWGQSLQQAIPATTTRSLGTKIIFYEGLSGSATDWAYGLAGNEMWASVGATAGTFRWYAVTTAFCTSNTTFFNHNAQIRVGGGVGTTNGATISNTSISVGNSTINTTANSTTILVNGVDLVATQKRAIAMSMIFGR